MSSTTMSSTSPQSKTHFLTLPLELRQQIYHLVYFNLTVHPYPRDNISVRSYCPSCLERSKGQYQQQREVQLPPRTTSHHTSTTTHTSQLFSSALNPLLTNKQFYTEALPIFYNNFTLSISSLHSLTSIHASPPRPPTTPPATTQASKIRHVHLTIHFTEENGRAWYHALTRLTSKSMFPNLTSLVLEWHMRSPSSYDRLIDAIYIAAPLVSNHMPTHLRYPISTPTPTPSSKPNHLTISMSYAVEELMFESPLLGPITTADSLEAHTSVVGDLLDDEEFRLAAGRADFEAMTGRLLSVARRHEEGWLETLQRRRLGGWTVREVQERVAGGMIPGGGGDDVGGVGMGGVGDGDEEVDTSDEEEDLRDENGWTARDWEEYRRRVGDGGRSGSGV